VSQPTHPLPVQVFQADALPVRVYATLNDMAEAAAHSAHECLAQAVRDQGFGTAILASAASQVRFLDILTSLAELDWSRVTLFHMDEYLGITADHPASFRRFLREKVAQRINPRACHYIAGDSPLPLDECGRYAQLLRAQPIDLCCLGIGENGHVAFNDPPVAAFDDQHIVKIVGLDEACRRQQVGEGAFPNLEAVPQYAFTLTIPALCSAKQMICVVPERRKAQAVCDALRGPISTACPASFLRGQPHCTLFLDAESATLL
jgi:glucosamine-6-phosphate deaminase